MLCETGAQGGLISEYNRAKTDLIMKTNKMESNKKAILYTKRMHWGAIFKKSSLDIPVQDLF